MNWFLLGSVICNAILFSTFFGSRSFLGAQVTLVFFTIFMGIYGTLFLAVADKLLSLLFESSFDKYHFFLIRFSGLLIFMITLSMWYVPIEDGFKLSSFCVCLFNAMFVTYAELWLTPKKYKKITLIGLICLNIVYLCATIFG